ncbi:MAG: efflux RND transporter permease subunit, partial [Desulfuromonadales bacterium]
MPELLAEYPGLSYDLEGEDKNRRESMESIFFGFRLVLIVIFALLAVPFRSYSQPLLIMAAIPFGIVGAILGHFLMGYDLSILSMFGIVALTGVVVNDSLLLIDYINQHRRDGKPLRASVVIAGQRRFRPILLTSLTTFFGLTPMILETSVQAQFLVPMAISLAFLASCFNFFRGQGEVWFDSVVMFIFFLSLGRHMEMMLRHRNLQAGAALARLLPEWAERVRDGTLETVPAGDLEQGDRVLVACGASFPADGVIHEGATEVDEALLTGESRAVAKSEGDEVIAGTINLTQPVEVAVKASGQETVVSALGRLLLRAQSTRPSTNSLPPWLVPVFISAVLVIAGFTYLAWSALGDARAFPAMLAVLVASCPCAISLALPVVHAAASRRLLDEGVLLTRGDALQALNEVDTVVFDKTGTLTGGSPELVSVELNPERGDVEETLPLRIAAALEMNSAHPIARALQSAQRGSRSSGPGPL